MDPALPERRPRGLGRMPADRGPAAVSAALATPRGREILQAAAELFQQFGYATTGIAQVADRAGLLKGSLYHYITTKEDLLFAIIDDVHQTALTNLASWHAEEGDAYSRLRTFIQAHLTHIAKNFVFAAVWLHDFRSLSAERQSLIVRERDVYDGYLRTLIRHGQADGLICPDLDAKVVSMGIFGMLNWTYQWYRPGGELTPESLADQFADVLLSGLACGELGHQPRHKRRLGTPVGDEDDIDLAEVLVMAKRAAVRRHAPLENSPKNSADER